jgi:hypothetical protein
MEDTLELFRPTGPQELALVAQSGYRSWPPRLDWQPIFYPVLNEAYAAHIAREWNATKQESEYSGFVTRFRARRKFLRTYEVHRVGGRVHEEYWIPAEDLEELNRNIVGLIEVVAEYRGGPDGHVMRVK